MKWSLFHTGSGYVELHGSEEEAEAERLSNYKERQSEDKDCTYEEWCDVWQIEEEIF
jgi:hypothetical protein